MLQANHYLQLIRFDKPAGTWLLMLPCWWGVLAHAEGIPLLTLALFAIGAFAMRSAGCIVNDMTDKDIDRQVSRTASRPLATGILSTTQAMQMLAVLLLIAALSAWALGWKVLLLGLAFLPLVIFYPRMKRITYYPQVFLGITFGSGALFGTVAMTGNLTSIALWLYLAGIFWVIGYDTIYACQDKADDARIGVKSTALAFGDNVRNWVAVLYTLMFFCLIGAFLNIEHHAVWQFIPLCMTAILLWQQWRNFQPANSDQCMRLFKSNVWVGFVICLLFV